MSLDRPTSPLDYIKYALGILAALLIVPAFLQGSLAFLQTFVQTLMSIVLTLNLLILSAVVGVVGVWLWQRQLLLTRQQASGHSMASIDPFAVISSISSPSASPSPSSVPSTAPSHVLPKASSKSSLAAIEDLTDPVTDTATNQAIEDLTDPVTDTATNQAIDGLADLVAAVIETNPDSHESKDDRQIPKSALEPALPNFTATTMTAATIAGEQTITPIGSSIKSSIELSSDQSSRQTASQSASQATSQTTRNFNKLVSKLTGELLNEPLIQSQLARRLAVSPSTIGARKLKPDFAQWSQMKDPQGLIWRYCEDTRQFFPELPPDLS